MIFIFVMQTKKKKFVRKKQAEFLVSNKIKNKNNQNKNL